MQKKTFEINIHIVNTLFQMTHKHTHILGKEDIKLVIISVDIASHSRRGLVCTMSAY